MFEGLFVVNFVLLFMIDIWVLLVKEGLFDVSLFFIVDFMYWLDLVFLVFLYVFLDMLFVLWFFVRMFVCLCSFSVIMEYVKFMIESGSVYWNINKFSVYSFIVIGIG